jgi:hypothetical protein
MSLVVLFGGILLDNFSSRKIILWASVMAMVGIATIPYTIYGFGLVYGAAAALLKLAPFSAPLKLKDGQDGLRVSPQGSAKNFGGALFSLALGTVFVSMGLPLSMTILGLLFLAAGLFVYHTVPDDRIKGWKVSVFKKLAKDSVFWLFMLYFFFLNTVYYVALADIFPSLVKVGGFSKDSATFIVGMMWILAGVSRFLWGWFGDVIEKYRLHLLILGIPLMGMSMIVDSYCPVSAAVLFGLFSSIHTPVYWAYAKQRWGKECVSTVIGLGFVSMYLGAGLLYGKWS